jgi:hypothetical protein
MFLFAPIFAFAQAPAPGTGDVTVETMKLLPALLDAIVNGKWVVLGAIVVMIGTLFVRQYAVPKWGMPENLLPYVSMILAAIYGIGGHVMAGMEAGDAAILVLVSGGLASQMWDALGKFIAKKILGDKYAENPQLPGA